MRLEVRFTSSGSTHTRLEHLLPPPFPSALVANRLIPVRGAPLFRRDGWTQVLETERVYYLLNGELTGEGGRRERLTENLEKSSEGKDGGNRKIPTFPSAAGFTAASGGWRVRYLLALSGPLGSASRTEGASLGQHGKWNCFPPA